MSDQNLANEFSWDSEVEAPVRGPSRKMDKIKFIGGTTVRLLILDTNPVTVLQHFKQGFGYLRCLGGTGTECPACAAGDKPAQKFGVNVLLYPSGVDKASGVSADNVAVKAWIFNTKVFMDLRNVKSEWGPLDSYDLKVACTKETFQEVTITNCKEALMQHSPDALRIQSKIQNESFDLKRSLGRLLTAEQVLGIWNGTLTKDDIFKRREDSHDMSGYAAPVATAPQAATQYSVPKIDYDAILGGSSRKK